MCRRNTRNNKNREGPNSVSTGLQNEELACMEVWGGNASTEAAIERPGLSCSVYSRSYGSGDFGGDVYYLSSCASGRLTRFLLADVCGHGESAAGTAGALRELMRQNVNRIRQTQLVEAVNRELTEADLAGRFATALVGTWFSPTSQMVLSNAGHPIPLLYRASTGRWSLCDGRPPERVAMQDMPLGIDERTSYSEHRVKLKPGDLLLCYTDALSESIDAEGNQLQTSGLIRLLESLESPLPDSLTSSLLGRLEQFSPDNLDRDDLTVMLFTATTRPVPLADSLLAPLRYLRNLVVDRVTSRSPRPTTVSDPVPSSAL
jgi:sigma-B regulation protein RsbU (phosphoserine phosphatase)